MSKILIVEDDPALQGIYETLFKIEKFDVRVAGNGKVALVELKKEQPDIILLDVLMPVMNGLEFLKVTKPHLKYPNVKVLVLSNLSDPKTVNEIDKLGATDYLLKANTSPRELVDKVRSMLG
jgi:DNA-binding response OmpR family regulator